MKCKILLLALLVAASPTTAQQVVTSDDYTRAEQFMSWNTSELVFNARVSPMWLSDDRFWYRNDIPAGTEFVLVDPTKRERARAFDHSQLAGALSAVTDTTYEAFDLPFQTFEFTEDGQSITFDFENTTYICDMGNYDCTVDTSITANQMNESLISPDGTLEAFIREHNLWMRNRNTGNETRLTADGVEHFGYATNNAGWIKRDTPVLLWSPDSKKIATFQHDARGVGDMYLVSTEVGHPRLKEWRYPLPEDSVIFRLHRVIIDVDEPRVIRLNMPPDMHRSTITDHVADWDGTLLDAEWSDDASHFAFVSSSRDHKEATLRVADPETGDVREVMKETVETFFESGFRKVNWHVLNNSDEVIWYSQRSDWGHLYLYDLENGELHHQITKGTWNVLQLLHIDAENRMLYFTGSGREPGNPYFQYLYRINMDGSDLRLLTPEYANHRISLSPSGEYFVDSYSTPVESPITVLRDATGQRLLRLEYADIDQLVESGWHPPIPFTAKARDGWTDLYGLLYKPSNFDSSKSYPVLNYVYPGPQSGSVGSWSFYASRGDKQALAELGFIVVEVNAMGTPQRSKSFHAFNYGNLGDNGIPDQIAVIQELAGQHPWIDSTRVGIWGHSGGGYASARAILAYPDFYKVAVASSGNHDNRNYEDAWGEKWHGLLKTHPDGTTNYDNQANQLLAKNLKGKLLLAHGLMDSNVPPSTTLLLVEALIDANKDFDLLIFPTQGHSLGLYMLRRRWDYFVRHLLGAESPKEYEFQTNSHE